MPSVGTPISLPITKQNVLFLILKTHLSIHSRNIYWMFIKGQMQFPVFETENLCCEVQRWRLGLRRKPRKKQRAFGCTEEKEADVNGVRRGVGTRGSGQGSAEQLAPVWRVKRRVLGRAGGNMDAKE